jgi:hypothetical protein
LADRVSDDRYGPCSIPSADDSCHARKFSYVSTLIVFYAQSRIPAIDFQPAVPDGLIGLLFVAAFWATRPSQLKAGVVPYLRGPATTSEAHERIVPAQPH